MAKPEGASMHRLRERISVSYAAVEAEYWTLTFDHRIAERNQIFQDIAAFAQILECGKDNVTRMIQDRRLCAIRVGAHYRIHKEISLQLLGTNAIWYDPREGN